MKVMNATGNLIDPYNLKAKDFEINVIAQTLSRICRFWGQTSSFYSVAQHCLVMVDLFEGDVELQKWALMHEAFEGLTGMDVPSPIKHSPAMESYRNAEKLCLSQMAQIFGLYPDMPQEIKIADKRLMVSEALVLMNTQNYDWTSIAPSYDEAVLSKIAKEAKIGANMQEVELRFLKKFNELFRLDFGAHKKCKDFAHELCPHCDGTVVLKNGFVPHTCKCGENILPCALCTEECCGSCPFEK